MILIVIGIFIIICSLINYKFSLFLFLGFKMMLTTNAVLVSIPGIPLLTIDMFISIYFVIGYLVKYRKNNAKISFPYLTPMLLYGMSVVISSVLGMAGITNEMSALVGTVFQDILFMVILWNVIETDHDFKQIFSVITMVFFASVIYGLIESSTHQNPFLLYQAKMNSDPQKVIDITDPGYILIQRGHRIRSFFEHPIGAGVNWALYVSFMVTAWLQYNEKKVIKVTPIITAILCVPCIILTKMRSSILFLVMGLMSCVNFKKKRMYLLLLVIPVLLFLGKDYFIDNSNIFLSLFNKDIQSAIGGSTLQGRLQQFYAGFRLFSMSPIWGLGSKFMSVISNNWTEAILGMESIWLRIMIQYGILGVMSQIFLAYYQIVKIPKYFHSKELRFISLAFWVVRTVTSIPGMHDYLYYLCMMYYIKKSDVYQSKGAIKVKEWRFRKGMLYHTKHVFDVKSKK